MDSLTHLQFALHRSDMQALSAAARIRSVQRLVWFNHGFMRAEIREDQFQLADLRMGAEPDYAFRLGEAERQQDGWRAIPPVDVERDNTMEAMRRYWQRWRNRDQDVPAAQAAAETSGTTPATNASK